MRDVQKVKKVNQSLYILVPMHIRESLGISENDILLVDITKYDEERVSSDDSE